MKTYPIRRIIDVNMYCSISYPEAALGNDEISPDVEQKYNHNLFTAFVCSRAIIELKGKIKQLPAHLNCKYVEGSGYIDSPNFYNYRGYEFCFKVECDSEMSEEEVQVYLTNYFLEEWNSEFGSAYNIYECTEGNCRAGNFYSEDSKQDK